MSNTHPFGDNAMLGGGDPDVDREPDGARTDTLIPGRASAADIYLGVSLLAGLQSQTPEEADHTLAAIVASLEDQRTGSLDGSKEVKEAAEQRIVSLDGSEAKEGAEQLNPRHIGSLPAIYRDVLLAQGWKEDSDIDELLAKRADAADAMEGETPLAFAFLWNFDSLIIALLENGANPNKQDHDGCSLILRYQQRTFEMKKMQIQDLSTMDKKVLWSCEKSGLDYLALLREIWTSKNIRFTFGNFFGDSNWPNQKFLAKCYRLTYGPALAEELEAINSNALKAFNHGIVFPVPVAEIIIQYWRPSLEKVLEKETAGIALETPVPSQLSAIKLLCMREAYVHDEVGRNEDIPKELQNLKKDLKKANDKTVTLEKRLNEVESQCVKLQSQLQVIQSSPSAPSARVQFAWQGTSMAQIRQEAGKRQSARRASI